LSELVFWLILVQPLFIYLFCGAEKSNPGLDKYSAIELYPQPCPAFKGSGSRHEWLTPIILAIQEAEMEVQSQPGQIVHETLSQNTQYKKGWQSDSSDRADT
jgi:hypothetical protein